MIRLAALRFRVGVLACLGCWATVRADDSVVTGGRMIQFAGACPAPAHFSRYIKYSFDLSQEHFWLYVPASYDGKTPWGLVVYNSPSDQKTDLPQGWAQVLNDDKLLFICPQQAGNGGAGDRREGLAVMAALEMPKQFSIDPKRIYAAGFSGGARIASGLGFHQSDIFHATIQSCGSDFYKAVPRVAVTDADLTQYPGSYGVMGVDPADIAAAKAGVKFTIVTGSGDFREHFLQDIYNGGFSTDGFQAKLWDVQGMGHEPCSSSSLRDALAFIEGGL